MLSGMTLHVENTMGSIRESGISLVSCLPIFICLYAPFSNFPLGKSKARTAGSFVRLTRQAEPEQSFVEAVHQKYATEITAQPVAGAVDTQIVISGKVAEEVGFDKIRQQLSQLHELRIILVDGLRINCAERNDNTIRSVCPKIVELDLSRNLFEDWEEVAHICRELDNLRSLRLK